MSKNEFYIILGSLGVITAYFLSQGASTIANTASNLPGNALQSGSNFVSGVTGQLGSDLSNFFFGGNGTSVGDVAQYGGY